MLFYITVVYIAQSDKTVANSEFYCIIIAYIAQSSTQNHSIGVLPNLWAFLY